MFIVQDMASQRNRLHLIDWSRHANVDSSTAGGNEDLKRILSDSIDPDMFFFFSVNTTCIYNTCPGGSAYIYFYAHVGHCKSTRASNPDVKYNIYNKSHDRVIDTHHFPPKNTRGCV